MHGTFHVKLFNIRTMAKIKNELKSYIFNNFIFVVFSPNCHAEFISASNKWEEKILKQVQNDRVGFYTLILKFAKVLLI